LKKAIAGLGTVNNPLDLVAGAGGESFKQALSLIRNDRNFDTIIPIFVPPVTINQLDVAVTINQLDVAKSILEGIKGTKKTVLACFMGAGEGSEGVDYLKRHGVPVYIFPEAIAKASIFSPRRSPRRCR